MADSLEPHVVEPLLRGRFGRPYVYAERCASTQLLLEPSLPEGAVAVCEEQAAGRGRLGRAWHAPPRTSVLCSTLLRPPWGRRAPELSLVAGLAAAETVEDAVERRAQIKWPNDVLVEGHKVAGVLAEARGGAVVVGVGINVDQREDELPRDAPTPAGSLRTLDGREHARAPLLATLLARLELHYDRWRNDGVEAIRDALTARDFLRGRAVTVDGVTAIAAGIDRVGRLVIDVDGDERAIESGDVRVSEPRG